MPYTYQSVSLSVLEGKKNQIAKKMADLGAAVPLRAVFEKVMRTIEEEKGVSLESLAW